MKVYKARYPQNFGLPPTYNLLFRRTENGYSARTGINSWIGMPINLIEKTPKLFQYEPNKTTVGRNRTPNKIR